MLLCEFISLMSVIRAVKNMTDLASPERILFVHDVKLFGSNISTKERLWLSNSTLETYKFFGTMKKIW